MTSVQFKTWLAALLLLASTLLLAFKQPQQSALRDKAYRDTALSVSQIYLPASQASSREFNDRLMGLQALAIPAENAYLDTRSGRFGTLITQIPLLPGDGQDNDLSWQSVSNTDGPDDIKQHQSLVWDTFLGFVDAHESTLGIDISELQNPGTVTILKGGDLIQINGKRLINGIAVRDSFVNAVISHGNLTLFGTRNWSDMIASKTPAISVNTARNQVAQHLGSLATQAQWGKSSLLYIPVDNAQTPYRLVWSLQSTFASDELAQWEALIDAQTGDLVAFQDTTQYATTRQIVGGQYPLSNDGVAPDGIEMTSPMPYADVAVDGQTYYSDTGGNILACLDGAMTTTLSGQYLTMNDTCGSTSETSAGPILDLGSGSGTDCAIPSGANSDGNTHASRSGFYEINRIIEMAQAQLPNNQWLRNPVPAQMNVNDNCNASGGAGGFNFFTSGGGCANTGELAGVFDHEWGHGMDASDANPGVSNPAEGIADIYASLRLNTSCMGRNFRQGTNCSGFGDACTSCDGVRDIDFAKRASGQPHDLAWIDANCGSGPSPCGGITHCEGAVVAETVWDLWNRDLANTPFNMNPDTAREVATQLTFAGSGMVGNWYSCAAGTGTGDGCNADGGYLNYLAADDDDGNLANGTPHMEAIYASFDRHGIACPMPAVQNSGCAVLPATAPIVNATAIDRGVNLSWTAVADASSYRIYKTEGVQACDFGKTLIGETSELNYQDLGLANGRDYSYVVIPMGSSDSCFGVASSCSTVTPMAGANIGLDQLSTSLTVNSGDNDPYLDNCEAATVDFDITNLGTGSLNNVVIESVESISHPSINPSIVISSGSVSGVAECSIATTGFSFVGKNLSFNDVIDFKVCVTSAELSPSSRCNVISIKNTESDDAFLASKSFSFENDRQGWTVNRGTFDRTSSGSAADGVFALRSSSFQDNQCDRLLSPNIQLSSTSTISMQNNFDIESQSSGIWWDRANVSIMENENTSLITPDGGRLYNASVDPQYSGCNNDGEGWAGSGTTWQASSWSPSALSGLTGTPVKLAVTYGTDGASVERGFWVDAVTITDAIIQVPDNQPDTLCGTDLIFKDGFEEPVID